MRKHKLALAAILSLVLMLPLVGSYFIYGEVTLAWPWQSGPQGGERECGIWIDSGQAAIRYVETRGGTIHVFQGGHRHGPLLWYGPLLLMRWTDIRANLLTLGWTTSDVQNGNVQVHVSDGVAPSWMLTLICVPAPALWLRRRRKQSHQIPGHCPTCGYDLRATPTRCPECGTTPIPTPTQN